MVEKQADGESKWPLLPSAPCCNKCVSTAAGFSPQDEQTVITHYRSSSSARRRVASTLFPS
jgi:hypothetical protein